MVCSDIAELTYDKAKDEVIVTSKLKFSNKEKVVAAVSVLFIQTKDELDPGNRIEALDHIPTSLSVINLPQVSHHIGNKLIRNLVTEKFTENLNPVSDNLNQENHSVLEKQINVLVSEDEPGNGMSIKIENENGNVCSDRGNSDVQKKSLNIACQTDCGDFHQNTKEVLQKMMIDVSTNTEHLQETDTKQMASTSTERDSEAPLKRRKMNDSNESIYYGNEGSDIFIITKNKSFDDGNSQRQESLVESSNSKKQVTESSKLPSFLADDSKNTPQYKETSEISNIPVFMIHESDSESVETNKNQMNDDNDLSTLPVFCSNFESESSNHDDISMSSNQQGEQNETNTKQPFILGGQKQRFFKSISKVKKTSADKCQICNKVLLSLADMFCHSKIHNLGIKCCVCGMKAFDWGVMKHHYSWHLSKTPFKCPQCSATYNSRELLAAHMVKAHSASRSFVNIKNPKLKPPASKLTVNQKSIIPKIKLHHLTNKSSSQITSDVSSSSFQLTQFSSFSSTSTTSNSVHQPEHITVRPLSPLNSRPYSCNEKLTSVEKLKHHVEDYHPKYSTTAKEKTLSVTVDTPTPFIIDDNATCGSSSHFVTGENSNTESSVLSMEPSYQPKIKQEIPEVIDIEQLGQFTESFDNSRSSFISNTSNDKISSRALANRTQESFEPTIPSSFDISPTYVTSNRQRKTACRLANIMPVCRICGEYLNSWNEILEHRFNHPDEIGEQLLCTVCPSALSTRDSLKRHAINHMGIRHQCLYCENEYSRRDSCLTHMKSAHGHGSNILITSNFSTNS